MLSKSMCKCVEYVLNDVRKRMEEFCSEYMYVGRDVECIDKCVDCLTKCVCVEIVNS